MSAKPEHPLAIRAFDYAAALAFGAVAALASSWVVPDALPGILAMILGMAVGLVAVIPLLGILTLVLGGFEILMLSMQVGMIAGMSAPMMMTGTSGTAALAGAGVGLVIQLILHGLDRSLHGEVAS